MRRPRQPAVVAWSRWSRAVALCVCLPLAAASGAPGEPPPNAPIPDAARRLLKGERPTDLATVYGFLRSQPLEGWGGSHFATMKDAVLKRLVEMRPAPPRVLEEMLAISSDTTAEQVARVYAVQYTAIVFTDRARANPGWLADPQATAAVEGWIRLLADPDDWLKGTVLTQLGHLCAEFPALDRKAVLQTALGWAVDEKGPPLTRVPGLQVSAALRNPGALPAARAAARVESPGMVRVAAIHALGVLGDERDLAQLRQWLDAPRHSAFRGALQAAIRQGEAGRSHPAVPDPSRLDPPAAASPAL